MTKNKNYENIPEEKPNLFNIQAEQIVLGMIILNNEYLWKIKDILKKGHFYEPAHQIIFEHILKTTQGANIVADSITLKAFFDNDELLKTIGGNKYLSILLSIGAGIVDIVDYARIIEDLFKKRLLVSLGEKIVNKVYKNVSTLTSDSIIEKTAQDLNVLQENAGFKKITKHLNFSIAEEILEIERSLKNPSHKLKNFIKTGFYDFDSDFKGFKRGELIILAGRPAMGKSSIALQISKNVALQDYNTLFFSLEMKASELSTKILANCGRINSENLDSGKISQQEFRELKRSYNEQLNEKKFYINDKCGINYTYIKNVLQRFKRSGKTMDFIVIDYLQIMTCHVKTQNRNQEIGLIMNGLLKISKEFNCVILCLSQLSRAVESRDDKRPFLNDLRDSGEIEQIANMVIFCYREVYYLKKELRNLDRNNQKEQVSYDNIKRKINKKKNLCELLIRKNRRGITGDCLLNFQAKYSLISDKENNKINWYKKK